MFRSSLLIRICLNQTAAAAKFSKQPWNLIMQTSRLELKIATGKSVAEGFDRANKRTAGETCFRQVRFVAARVHPAETKRETDRVAHRWMPGTDTELGRYPICLRALMAAGKSQVPKDLSEVVKTALRFWKPAASGEHCPMSG
jgi:hypothetical protein